MGQHRFDEPPMVDPIDGLRRLDLRVANKVQGQTTIQNERSKPTLVLPLVRHVGEVTVFVIRPSDYMAVINCLLEDGQEFVGVGSLEIYSHRLCPCAGAEPTPVQLKCEYVCDGSPCGRGRGESRSVRTAPATESCLSEVAH